MTVTRNVFNVNTGYRLHFVKIMVLFQIIINQTFPCPKVEKYS